MNYWVDSENSIHALLTITFGEYLCAFMQIVITHWNFEYRKALTLHCDKSGKSGIDPAAEVTQFGLTV